MPGPVLVLGIQQRIKQTNFLALMESMCCGEEIDDQDEELLTGVARKKNKAEKEGLRHLGREMSFRRCSTGKPL